jgi:hypothetical protein
MIPMRRSAAPALVLLLAACGGGGGGPPPGPGPSADVVASVDPTAGSVGVAVDAEVTIRFSTAMDEATLLGGALVLTPAGLNAPVDADIDVSGGGTEATLRPTADLAGNLEYQVRLSALARRADGREIGRPWFSGFRTEGSGPPPPPPPPAQGGTVRGVPSMAVGRSGHAAVALGDGRVAVLGGYDTSSSVTASIEVFDPVAETWTTSAAVLGTARARATATLLGDGRVLVAGGETASTSDVGLADFEILDAGAGAVVASGSMGERRTRHRAVRLPDGRVLVTGGSRTDAPGAPNFSRSSAEVFDPVAGTFSPVSAMAVTRAGHEATLLADGRVLVTGGHGSNPAAEVFDPAVGGFVGAGSMTEPRRDHTATLLLDGSVLVAGGGNTSADRWLPAQGLFFQVQNLGDVRSLHTAVRIGNGRVMVAGGEKPAAGGGVFFHNSMDFFDPPSSAFLFPDLRTRVPRTGHTATLLPGGDVLLAGGKNGILGQPALRSCDRVHPQ